jgi:excisionase family DNA binding protein
MSNDIMTIKEVADYLKISDRTAHNLAKVGTLPSFKVGAGRRFRKSELDKWIKKQSNGQV